MREGRIQMDGVDVYTAYSIFAVRGSWDDLVRLPAMKTDALYSWPTEHGDDVYLQSRKFAARDIELTFLMVAASKALLWQRRELLIAALAAPGYRRFNINDMGKDFDLYYIDCLGAKFHRGTKAKFELRLKFRIKQTTTDNIEP